MHLMVFNPLCIFLSAFHINIFPLKKKNCSPFLYKGVKLFQFYFYINEWTHSLPLVELLHAILFNHFFINLYALHINFFALPKNPENRNSCASIAMLCTLIAMHCVSITVVDTS